MDTSSLAFGLLAWLLSAATAPAVTETGTTRDCVDPCIQAARGARADCVSSAAGTSSEALDGCVDLDPDCVAACRAKRQSCRDETSLGADLTACDLNADRDKQRCRNELRPGSIRLAGCIERARARGFRCHREAQRGLKDELRACEASFAACADGCLPGSPPDGADSCRAQARDAFAAARGVCRTTFRVTTGGCLGKDINCVQECVAAAETCGAGPRGDLDAAIADCNAERDAGLAMCRSANPDGGQALEDCEETVWSSSFECRATATEAALPGSEACAADYAGCVRACPPA